MMASLVVSRRLLQVGKASLRNLSVRGGIFNVDSRAINNVVRVHQQTVRRFSSTPETIEEVDKESEEDASVTLDDLKSSDMFNKDLLSSLEEAKFTKLTPVQSRSLFPIVKEEKGLVVRAKTGTGKTLAFVIPTLQRAIESFKTSKKGKTHITTLVIAPTRDLALQIENEYKKVIAHMPRTLKQKLQVGVIMGGRKTELNGYYTPPIVIATPGRLNDKLRKPYFSKLFTQIEYRVYDESDRILDQGFRDTLDSIDEHIENARKKDNLEDISKSILFSATIDNVVSDFAKKRIGQDFKYINCVRKNEPEAHENITQVLVKTKSIYDSYNSSMNYIANGMKRENFKAIVFLPTVSGSDWYFSTLMTAKTNGVLDMQSMGPSRILNLHGKMSQAARDRSVRSFRKAEQGVLICTDVAARGLDFSDVTDVIQVCPSVSVADYIHKIGRTARAGTTGKATLFLSEYEENYKKALQTYRGIKFSEEINSDDVEAFKRPIINEIGVFEPSMEEFIKTYLSFQRQVQKAYRLDMEQGVKEIVGFYRASVQDPEAKLSVSSAFLEHIYPLPHRIAVQYFDLPANYKGSFSNKRSFSNKGSFSKRGSYSNNRGSYSNNRGSFSDNRGSYSDNRGSYSDNRGSYSNNRRSKDDFMGTGQKKRSDYKRSSY